MKEAARVLLVEVNEDGTAGGSHQCLFDLARNLDPSRFTPVVLFYQNNRFAERLKGMGVRTLIWEEERVRERPAHGPFRRLEQAVNWWRAVGRRIRLLRSERIDLVHMNNAPTVGFHDWLPAARFLEIPILTHARYQFTMPRRVWHRLVHGFDAVVAISHEIERFVLAQGFPVGRVVQIYDGIDVAALCAGANRTRDDVRRELAVKPDHVLVAMVGHLRTWKGQDVVLEALSRLDPVFRQFIKMVFVGGVGHGAEGYADTLRNTVGRYGLESTVSFIGERADAAAIMQAADIVLHASTTPEPFGLVVVEGMALGRAVIASGIGGPAEIVTADSGVLFDPTRPEALAAALQSLAGDPEKRRRLGEGGRRRANDFSLRHNVESVQALYVALLTGKPVTPT